ncbi:MAG TPA: hypothetical protein VFH03_09665 [Actinoplanes sp.]|nr:hypothetical protein [Actinoplanes sp.]
MAVNLLMLYLINVRPGWDAVPFFTDETVEVLPLINLSLVVSVSVNLLYLGYDRRWFVGLGGLATTGVGLVALIRMWQVFPFDFTADSTWALIVRVVLAFAIAGSVITWIVQFVQMVAGLAEGRETLADRHFS